MTTKTVSAGEAIKKLEEKDGEPNNESARQNENLAAHAVDLTNDALKFSLNLNDPSQSRAAYTSHKSGFNEDLEPKELIPGNGKK